MQSVEVRVFRTLNFFIDSVKWGDMTLRVCRRQIDDEDSDDEDEKEDDTVKQLTVLLKQCRAISRKMAQSKFAEVRAAAINVVWCCCHSMLRD